MPYRPLAEYRRVSLLATYLTAAIHRVFGSRAQDHARPLGAFYTHNIKRQIWEPLGGIWYRARNEQAVLDRALDEAAIRNFASSILTGEPVVLANGSSVTWELIPVAEALQLPPPLSQTP